MNASNPRLRGLRTNTRDQVGRSENFRPMTWTEKRVIKPHLEVLQSLAMKRACGGDVNHSSRFPTCSITTLYVVNESHNVTPRHDWPERLKVFPIVEYHFTLGTHAACLPYASGRNHPVM